MTNVWGPYIKNKVNIKTYQLIAYSAKSTSSHITKRNFEILLNWLSLYLCACFNLFGLFVQDFDLCVNCYDKDGHPHKMEKLGLDLDDGSSPVDQKQGNPQVMKLFSFCLHRFEHLRILILFYVVLFTHSFDFITFLKNLRNYFGTLWTKDHKCH